MITKRLFVIFAFLFTTVLFAQEEPAQEANAPEATVPTEADISTEKSVSDLINEYLNEKGWQGGENFKKNGEKFFIVTGVGVIQAPRNSQHYPASRVAAYNKAMLEAKSSLAEFLQISIKTETVKEYSEGTFPTPGNPAEAKPEDPSSTLSKIKQLVNAKLDKELRKEGIDPDKASKEQKEELAKKKLNSESYKKLISTSTEAYVLGLQAAQCFECTPASKKGQIGVVAIWSDKLQKMAEAMKTGAQMPSGIPKKAIKDQIPRDNKVLLLTFGVQQKINERGELVLVSFGQEGAVSDSPTSANAAKRKAQMNAQAAIREFAGESVAVASDMLNAETTEEFENAAEEYKNESAMKEKIKAVAAQMKISGIAQLKPWSAKHPVTGKPIYGSICTWSPSSAASALQMKKTMDNAKNLKPGQHSERPAPSSEELNKRSHEGRGHGADEDAF